MNQIMNYGTPSNSLPKEGYSANKNDIPLGQYMTDGQRMWRWVHVAETMKHGQVACQANAAPKALSTAHFRSAIGVPGYGGGAGDNEIKLYGVSAGLTDTALYEDGTFEIKSGTAGVGRSYVIDRYQVGGTGVTTLWLKEGLQSGLLDSCYVNLRKNPFYGLKMEAGATTSAIPVGSPVNTVTTSGYVWAQVKGRGMALAGVATTQGNYLAMGASGLLSTYYVGVNSALWAHVAIGLEAGIADKYFAVDWKIE